MLKIISNQLSPNLKMRDGWHGILALPFTKSRKKIDFSSFFQTQNYLLTNAGRTALAKVVEVLERGGFFHSHVRRVAIPAFTCAVTATPFLSKDFEIEWIDVNENGLISVFDFEKKSKEVSVVLVPHIFGQRAPLEEIVKIANNEDIFVVEDCAHFFNPEFISGVGAKIFSFGREKVFSCVSGGALVWPDKSIYQIYFENLNLSQAKLGWTIRHVLQPFFLSFCMSFWYFGGKFLAALLSKFKVFPRAVTSDEKKGLEDFPETGLAYPLQKILLSQLEVKKEIANHRKKIVQTWIDFIQKDLLQKGQNSLFFDYQSLTTVNNLRLILKIKNPDRIREYGKSRGFDLRDWDGEPIAPRGVDLFAFGYESQDCPKAEKFVKNYLTLPTNFRVTKKEIKRFFKK